jgi:hypothetical protein
METLFVDPLGGFLDAIGSGWQPGIPLGPAGQAGSFQVVTPAPSRHARLRILGQARLVLGVVV